MRKISFPLRYIDGFMQFCVLSGLNIQDKIVENTNEDAYVTLLVDGILPNNIEYAEQMYLVYSNKIVSLYGLFDDSAAGVNTLISLVYNHKKNMSATLQEISKLVDTSPFL